MPRLRSYSKEDMDDIVRVISRAQEMSLDDTYKRLEDVYYSLNDSIDRLTTRMDELEQEMDMIRRQNAIRSEASLDGLTRPSIDGGYEYLKKRLVTVKLLEDKLDEINFSQDLLKEDISQRLEDIGETTQARLRMQQGCIGHLQERMHVNEVARDIMKNKWTRGDEDIRSFVGTWFQMIKEDVNICFPASSHFLP